MQKLNLRSRDFAIIQIAQATPVITLARSLLNLLSYPSEEIN
ncbi:MAG: hypothetical protein SAJ37_17260 [Oscillatoria sp. PMC 1068.18]|nr:hypothetical protein [Oscillatoria sp. PMC 1076.18]MEC4990482.1 hypothetical protein [Oscillatoria sp. PMC 1068.18]